jgi:hypothetical protein
MKLKIGKPIDWIFRMVFRFAQRGKKCLTKEL